MTRLAMALKLYLMMHPQIDQKQLAERIGCSASSITRFTNGTGIPEAKTMLSLFQWLLEEHSE